MPGTLRRIARRASGGVPKKPLKKLRWLLVGWARVSVQDLIVPSVLTRNGFWLWSVETWKPVTLPTAWQGRFGQDGSGVVEVAPSVTVVFSTSAARRATAASAIRARAAAPSARATRAPAGSGEHGGKSSTSVRLLSETAAEQGTLARRPRGSVTDGVPRRC